MNWQGAIITNAGLELLARVEAGKTKLNITKLKTGDGVPQVIETMTDLVHPMQVIDITSVKQNTDNTVVINGIISNAELETGYYLREYGLFAADDNGNEVLYAVSVDSNPDYLQNKNAPTTISEELGLTIAVSNAESLNVTITQTGMASIAAVNSMISDHNNAANAHADIICWKYDSDGNIYPVERGV